MQGLHVESIPSRYHMYMQKSLPLIAAVIILIAVGVGLWYLFSKSTPPIPLPGGQTATTTPERVHNEESGAFYQIDTYYPSKTPLAGTGDASAVAVMKIFVEKEAANFKEIAETDGGSLAAEFPEFADRKYTLEADYDMYEDARTVTYAYHMYADTLGAHPNAYYRTFTFDKKSGDALHLEDLFIAGTEYLSALSTESRKILVAHIAEASGVSEDQIDREMLDAGTTPFGDNFQNFYFENDVLVIIFPPYQVGPWALGTQEARIPKATLKSILKVEYR